MNLRIKWAALSTALLCSTAAFARTFMTVLPVFVEDRAPENVTSLIGPAGGDVQAEAEPLLKLLSESVDQGVIRQLRVRATTQDGKQWLSLAALRELGLKAEYNEANLELRITLPPLLKRANQISVNRGTLPLGTANALAPSAVSGYLNANAGQDFLWGGTAPANGRQPLRSELDGAVNVKNWVLEGTGSYYEDTGTPWRRGDFRVVRDQPDAMLRYSAGDLNYPVTGFQRFQPMAGLSVVTNFSLQPYQTTTPVSTHEIFLKSRSIVKVFTNGRLVQQLDLPAGKYDLRDLPFNVGVNDAYLEITDDVGRVEIVRIPYVFSDQLLARGVSEVAYAVGIPSNLDDATRTYDSSRPAASVSHRLGLSDTVTVGSYFQGNRDQDVGGVSAVCATRLGTWNLEAAGSHLYEGAPGSGVRFGYIYGDYSGPSHTPRSFGLSAENRSPTFLQFGDTPTDPPADYNLSASYTQQIFYLTSLSLTGNYLLNRGGDGDLVRARTIALNVGHTWRSGIDASITATHTLDAVAGINNSLQGLLTWAFPEKNQYVNVSATTDDSAEKVQWNYNPSSRQVGGVGLAAEVDHSQANREVQAQANYTGNRMTASVTHDYLATTDGTASSQRTTLAAGTSLVFAGGGVGLSRPVTDSFVLVSAEKELRGKTVQLNPTDDGHYEARSDLLGPGIMPELTSYRYYDLHLSLPENRPGYELGKENYTLLPTYKSGFLIPVGTDALVFARGTLRDAANKILALRSGEVRSLSEPRREPEILFTNRDGRFGLEGLKPGKYLLELFGEEPSRFEFVIPPRARGALDLGTLRAAVNR